jgi:hypothetical protein
MSPRDRRALTIGACIVIPGLMIPWVIKPYLNALADIHSQTDDARDQLARERRAIAQLPKLPPAQTRAAQQLDAEVPRLFQANDVLVANGDLAEYVASAAQTAGVRLSQSETRPVRPVSGGVQALGLEIRAEGDLDGLLHFLNQLETGGKLIRLETVNLSGGGRVITEARGLPPELEGLQRLMQMRRFQPRGMGVAGAGQPGENDGTENQMQGSNPMDGVEVLSLSATLYGYRLDLAPWTLTETRGREAASPFARTAIDFASVDDIIAHDPFSATRTPPSRSYRDAMIAASQPAPVVRQPVRTAVSQTPLPHLVGTGLGSNSFAVAQAGNESPQLLHIGENIAGYTLIGVHRGSAEFTAPNGSPVRVYADAAGSATAAAAAEPRRRRRRRGDNQEAPQGQANQSGPNTANPSNAQDAFRQIQGQLRQMFGPGFNGNISVQQIPDGTTIVTTPAPVPSPSPSR